MIRLSYSALVRRNGNPKKIGDLEKTWGRLAVILVAPVGPIFYRAFER